LEQSLYGTAQFKVKYRVVELQVAPGATASSLGTLKKGAIVTIIGDENPYYYQVRLDNGLEGYIYKPAGELTSSVPTRLPAVAEVTESNNTVPPTPVPPTIEKAGPTVRPQPQPRTINNSRNGTNNTSSSVSSNTRMPTESSMTGSTPPRTRGGRTLIITSGEIAVFDKPGIVGRQVAKLKRGDKVAMAGQDSFFFQVSMPNGATGYIPRYSAEIE